jgi:hypothetical protein
MTTSTLDCRPHDVRQAMPGGFWATNVLALCNEHSGFAKIILVG